MRKMEILEKVQFSYVICNKNEFLDIDSLIGLIKDFQGNESSLQILDPSWIVSEKHLKIALYHTMKAFYSKRNIAREKETEILIRLSGYRQINKALMMLGVKDSTEKILIFAFGEKQEENNRLIAKFIKESQLHETDERLPVSSIEELSNYHKCNNNIDELEKRVIEKIALIEVL